MPLAIALGISPSFGTGGGGAPVIPDRAYPTFATPTDIAPFTTKSAVQGGGAIAALSDVTAPADWPFSGTALQLVTVGAANYNLSPSGVQSPIDLTNGSVGFTFKPVVGLSTVAIMQFFDIRLYSSGSPAAPPADYHSLAIGVGNAPSRFRALSTQPDTSTAGRTQRITFPVTSQNFSATGAGANLAAVTWAMLVLRSNTATTFTILIGKIQLIPNARAKGAIILAFDDLYTSQLTYAAPAMAVYGFPGEMYPGDVQTIIAANGGTGRMTLSQVQGLVSSGWDLASQAWSTEDTATLDAMTSPQRLTEFGSARDYPRSLGYNDSGMDGSYFSTLVATNQTSGPDLRATFRTLRRYDGGNDLDPPLAWGESYPFQDPYNIRALSAATSYAGGASTRLQQFVDQTEMSKGVGIIVWHNELAGAGDARTSFDALLPYLDGKRSTVEVTTMRRLLYP